MTRAAIFAAVKEARGKDWTAPDIAILDQALDALGVPRAEERRISDKGVALIKEFEGLRLDAYRDPVGVWTIGYGHTGGVHPGMRLSPNEAEQLLHSDLQRFEAAVSELAPDTTQGQFDALVSFAFNLGERRLAKSTLLKKHNAGDHAGAAKEFGLWIYAGRKKLPGLVRRRAAEAGLYRGNE